MRPQSAKAKGRRLQQWVRDTLLSYASGLQLTADDIRSTSMGAQGEDIQLSTAAKKAFPYSIECKNVEKLNIFAALEQAESNANPSVIRVDATTKSLKFEHITPMVVFKRNKSSVYVALEFEEFLRLTKKDS